MKRFFTNIGAAFTLFINKAIPALYKHAISLYIAPPNLLLFNELHNNSFTRPPMQKQALRRQSDIRPDGGGFAQCLVLVQDQLGALKPCKRPSGNCRCVDHI